MSYDAWLEKPYQERAEKSEAYVDWCEKNNLDPDDDHWDEWEDDQEQRREDYLIERAEALREERMLGFE